jgi:erythromycin esterase-like protein
MLVPSALPGSWDAVLHKNDPHNQLLLFSLSETRESMLIPRGQRAIGVVYNPDYEYGNYVPSVLPKRYDALLYIDRTHALRPLHMPELPDQDLPKTFPWGV